MQLEAITFRVHGLVPDPPDCRFILTSVFGSTARGDMGDAAHTRSLSSLNILQGQDISFNL